jgi:hypothetical protein
MLRADQFERELNRRGAGWFAREDLHQLHKDGVLVPMLEVVRDVDWAKRESAAAPGLSLDIFNQDPPLYAPELRRAQQDGRVHLARGRAFRSIAQRRRTFKGTGYYASDYLYSPYQLLLATMAANVLTNVGRLRRSAGTAKWRSSIVAAARRASIDFDATVGMLTLLEPFYWPPLAGHLAMPVHYGSMDSWWIERDAFDQAGVLEWTGWTADDVRGVGEDLVGRGHVTDPLRRWLDLTRLVHAEKADQLEGSALLAVDLRRAGEMCLRFYEDLAQKGFATPLPEIPWRAPHPLNERLKPDRSRLNAVLTDYGLSPHPSVLLVVEGATEVFVISNVMALLGIPNRDSRIRIVDLGGITKDPDLLARYVRPSLRRFSEDAAAFETPPLQILIVIDADGAFSASGERDKLQARWSRQYHAALPREFQTETTLAELGKRVTVQTWSHTAHDFEFAHFRPATLALALMETGRVPPAYDLDRLRREIVAEREAGRGIRRVWKSWDRADLKMELWKRLWPRLRRRLRGAPWEKAARVPVARIVLLADDMAHEPRRNMLLRVRQPAVGN